MDLEEWELLPEDGFLEIHDDGGKMIFSRKYPSNSNNEFNMDYFICPSPKSSSSPPQFVDKTEIPRITNQIVPFPIQETPFDHEVITKEIIITNKTTPSREEEVKVPKQLVVDQEVTQQVFFKKMKENEFEQMKLDSPKSNNNNKTVLSQVETDPFQFEEKDDDDVVEVEKEKLVVSKIEENNGGLNLLNKSLTGIGAICSFGVAAAATICIIFIGNRQKQKQNKQNQMFRFQVFSDDKRIKQVVHHATRLNEAISAVRGVPVTRAHITVGGHYDAL